MEVSIKWFGKRLLISKDKMNQSSEILTIEEVAKYLKMKPQTIYKWAQEGSIPATKLGKEWRFRKNILDDWIDTSITLSKGGFHHMINASAIGLSQNGYSSSDIDQILDEAME